MLPSIESRLAKELAARPEQVSAAVQLLDEGATVPFIARYRKEVTGGLDDIQLRLLEERLRYLRELEERREAILASINEQGKMTPELDANIRKAEDKTTLEDLYLPYKPKRRTKAQIAREAGLEPLADALIGNPMLVPEAEAEKYLRAEAAEKELIVPDVKAALEGAKQILMERFAEQAPLIGRIRDYLIDHAVVDTKVIEGKEEAGAKFSDYFNYSETWKTIPSHRALAVFRGRNEEMMSVTLRLDSEPEKPPFSAPFNPVETMIAVVAGVENKGRPADKWLNEVVRWTWRVKISLHLETELMTALRERSEMEAIKVFARNLKDLLLAAPAGPRATLGLDPGLRTGVKVAVVDNTGKVVDTTTIYPHEPRRDWEGSLNTLVHLVKKHNVDLVSIGNGTASRETDKLAADLVKRITDRKVVKIVVSEAGASVYSASEFASKELPDLDVSLRGAVSIARRLQDPLAELVKIDPKSIGVGQYQHDVNQTQLARSLEAVVEDCVNAVGVDVNTASAALLARVSGLTSSVAQNIVAHRDANGAFKSREQLKKVPRLGDKAFEQAAGFLRIASGDNPLDASAVHPEAYPVVEKILADIKQDIANIRSIMGDSKLLKSLHPEKYADERFGVPTVTDILRELEKPGRDPRPEFKTAAFQDGVEDLRDLQPGMILEGVVTNVAAFGAFVDIGVHQDGLVHISALSEKFVKDAHEVVKAGQVVKVKVLEVDEKRRRVALTMRLNDTPGANIRKSDDGPRGQRDQRSGGGQRFNSAQQNRSQGPAPGGAMAEAFARLKAR
ncbi:MAG: RNA-binding transcriptional accessory protein [Betaproteobacteria bacterium]|nr:RNA-binding transcriptional accessory protein [Betaproteobacteria bacterium]